MDVLIKHGVSEIYHYAPIHYLPFITRVGALLSKPALSASGYPRSHFRSTSKSQDERRGFGRFVHLTIEKMPRILQAKLSSGFPHFEIVVDTKTANFENIALCRYNIAKCRYLLRPGGQGLPVGPATGRYYPGLQIPIAKTRKDRETLLVHNLGKHMIEVLVPFRADLPESTRLTVFRSTDRQIVEATLAALGVPWEVQLALPEHHYIADATYERKCNAFINRALDDLEWRGDGLEFDNV